MAHATKIAFGLLILLIAVASQSPALAQTAEPDHAPPSAIIEAAADLPTDAVIGARIAEIFSQIESLADAQVSVQAGVVTLRGTVARAEDAARAESVARRVQGVVTVENKLDRDLSVDENLAPVLTQLKGDTARLLRALPLVVIALVIAALIAVAGFVLARIDRLWRWLAPNNFLAELLATSVRVVFIALGLFVALDILNATAALGAILGGAGVIGLAIGFAVRDTVDNYISSIMLSIRQPFRPMDHVVIGSHEGRVVRLTSRATILITLDGNHLRVPNSTVFKSDILNYTRNPERRFEFELGVDADDDPIAATAVAIDALDHLDFVLRDPPASAHIKDVGDSNIVLTVTGWVNQIDTDFLKGRSVAIRAAKSRLEAAGFALPEPIYRLRFDNPGALPQLPKDRDSVASTPVEQVSAHDAAPPVVADVSRDSSIEQKVIEERNNQVGDDLLSHDQPVE